jgi:hypothetical protein
MKNIFVLPTDRPSFLFKDIKDNLMFNKDWIEIPVGRVNQNIYITSNEEISGLENNIWVYNNGRVWLWENTMALRSNNKTKKIILTTDPKLIADGVQAIDDEFLQWFVKNPSCEFVEVTNDLLIKKDGITELMKNEYYQKFPEELPYCVFINDYKIITPKEEPKQETSEEAAERLYPTTIDSFTDNGFDLSERERLIFINGVKWQQEQDKNKYSEEDMMEAVRFGMLYKSDSSKKLFEKKGMTPTEVLKKWFDKVKKK